MTQEDITKERQSVEMSSSVSKPGLEKGKSFIKNYKPTHVPPKQYRMRSDILVGNDAFSIAMGEDQPDHITNLALFGLERSDGDLNWKWQSVGNLISERNDPARPPVRGCNKKFVLWKMRRIVENIYFRLFTFFLIVLDVGLVVTEIAISCSGNPVSIIIRHVDLVISVYFIIEVILRIIVLTPKVFFSCPSWHNIVDFFVVILAFVATIAGLVIIMNIPEQDKEDVANYKCEKSESTNTGKSFSFIVALRFIRIFRFVRLLRIYFEHHNLVKSVRQRISENKRRFQVDGYDLDLTYITTNVIAMSFPSKGNKALYRNKIDNVATFFEEKYSDERNIDYMIYNLCSEMEYDHRKFHGNVKRFEIDDHNVPSLEQMLDLVDDVRDWLQGGAGRVVALHCKGGKGRTGTMICAILIDQGMFQEACDTLQYFGQRRTDLNVSKQFQGVETYSQIRYVHYFQQLHSEKIKVIPSRPLFLKGLNITALEGIGAGDGSDFSVTVFSGGKNVLNCQLQNSDECEASYNSNLDKLEVKFKQVVIIDKDTKFMFHSSTKGVPRGYDDCAFFCWLHTFFIKDMKEVMTRAQLDNPHKEKTWGVWRESFSVQIFFENGEYSSQL